ncbi:DUF6344 domain-containing protein [Streptomyces scabiei]|uniref:DUF6344 domain-containing protein n=1 Tax=Streptomyces scabiei TaxID=1930 RepID=UPI000A36C4E3|nr:DUF6344 domain-containing protein [Streptomyces scabiei]
MAQNTVMKLWTAIVTAVLTLCTALGLITTTASAAVPQTESTRNCAVPTTTPAAMTSPARPHDRALPPTMKQRIRAEAHGSSPSCRHRTPLDTAAINGAALEPPHPRAEQPAAPLQR